TRFLTIPGDVPCASAAEIRALLAAPGGERAAAFVPSLSGFGTNAALLAPPDVMALKFGEPSFANHLESARARGLVPIVLDLPGIGLDVDAPEDLRLLLARRAHTRGARPPAAARRAGARGTWPPRAGRCRPASRSSASPACPRSRAATISPASPSTPPAPRARRCSPPTHP